MAVTNPVVLIKTSMGDVKLELDRGHAPISTENFLDYVRSGQYDGTIFHRVIEGFMIQGGGFDVDMRQRATKAPIANEAANGLSNVRGSIAMARTAVVDSATSQFFINVVDNGFLNHRDDSAGGYGYAVFGKVIDGMEVVDAIRKVPTATRSGHQDVPLVPIVIESATVEE